MQKKPVIIIAMLCVISLGLGYWVGRPKEGPEGGVGNGGGGGKEPEFLKQGLVAYYPFNGNAKDESGNGNDGEVNGATLVDGRNGNSNSAYNFDGIDDYIDLAPLPLTSNKALTVLFCAKLDRSKKNRNYLIDLRNSSSHGKTLSLSHNGYGAGKISFASYGLKWLRGSIEVPVSQWNFIALSYNQKTKKVNTYINGEMDIDEVYDELAVEDYATRIGASVRGGSMLKGSIDDIRIYNRALSEAEVKALYEFEKVK